MLVSFLFLFFLIIGVSLTRPVLPSFLTGEFYTSRAGFIFTHPVLFLCREFLLHFPCRLHFCEGNLTHPTLFSFLCGEFLLHIPVTNNNNNNNNKTTTRKQHGMCKRNSYTSRAGFFFFFFGVRSFFPLQSAFKQSLKKRARWKLAQGKSVKISHSNQRRKP